MIEYLDNKIGSVYICSSLEFMKEIQTYRSLNIQLPKLICSFIHTGLELEIFGKI